MRWYKAELEFIQKKKINVDLSMGQKRKGHLGTDKTHPSMGEGFAREIVA